MHVLGHDCLICSSSDIWSLIYYWHMINVLPDDSAACSTSHFFMFRAFALCFHQTFSRKTPAWTNRTWFPMRLTCTYARFYSDTFHFDTGVSHMTWGRRVFFEPLTIWNRLSPKETQTSKLAIRAFLGVGLRWNDGAAPAKVVPLLSVSIATDMSEIKYVCACLIYAPNPHIDHFHPCSFMKNIPCSYNWNLIHISDVYVLRAGL